MDEKVVVSILELTTQHVAITDKTQSIQTKFTISMQLSRQVTVFAQKEILQNTGKVSAAIAKSFAEKEYDSYKPIQESLFVSDFDKMIKEQMRELSDD